MAMELIDKPIALIGQFMIRIIQSAEPMHVIILPSAIIIAAFLVIELAIAITHTLQFLTFIPAAILILLHHILSVYIFWL